MFCLKAINSAGKDEDKAVDWSGDQFATNNSTQMGYGDMCSAPMSLLFVQFRQTETFSGVECPHWADRIRVYKSKQLYLSQ